MMRDNDYEAQAQFEAHVAHRVYFDNLFDAIYPDFDYMDTITQPEDYDCLRFMVNVTEAHCGRLDDYTLKFVKRLVHTCETGNPEEIGVTAELIASMCVKFPIDVI